MTEIQEHLGGYLPGGDEATQFPDLWAWLVDEYEVKTVLDVGCGEGIALDYFREVLDCEVWGIDGVNLGHPDVINHDFTRGRLKPNKVDLVWTCEFVEHVEEKYLPNVIPALTAAPVVAMTHAFPGQGGHHHVNCRVPEYWAGVWASEGYRISGRTGEAREVAAKNTNPWNHFVRAGMIFEYQGGGA